MTVSAAGTARASLALQTLPQEMALSPGVADAAVAFLEGSERELRGARLDVIAPPGVRVAVAPLPAAGGGRGWRLTLRGDAGLVPSTVLLMARTRTGRAASAIKIGLAAAPQAVTEFSAKLAYDGESLTDRAVGHVHLRLTNLGQARLRVRAKLFHPGFLSPDCRSSGSQGAARPDPVLAPGASGSFDCRITIRTSDSNPLVSGKHQISALVSAHREGAARPWQGSQLVTADLTVGIPGLEGIQTLVQVPSFLLLPGFLVCVVFLMTWTFWRPGAEGQAKASIAAIAMSPALWVLAITISMVMVGLYPSLTDLIGRGRRDLLQGFDLSDVITMWLFSLLVGLLAGNAAIGVKTFREHRAARTRFASADDPITVLRKMQLQRMSLNRMLSDTAAHGRLFSLGVAGPTDKSWAVPAIRYKPAAGHDPQQLADAALRDEIDRVVELIDAGGISLDWAVAAGSKGPRVVDARVFDRPNQIHSLLDPA
jgi:hypothetical protein